MSDEDEFETECENLQGMFMHRGYPASLIDNIKQEVCHKRKNGYFQPLLSGLQQQPMPMESSLDNKNNRVYMTSFLSTFSLDYVFIRDIINKNWNVIREELTLIKTLGEKPRITYMRGLNLKALLEKKTKVPNSRVKDTPCSDMLGMLSGLISDSQITASSTRDYQWTPSAARLVSSRSGWFPQQTALQPGEEWLQVDLGSPKAVSGVIIQGARGGDSSSGSASENKAFVRKFKVSHSMSGEKWEYIKDMHTQQPMIFEGNFHYDTPEIRRIDHTPAQYIRVYPERWSVAGIGMRLEVLGCDWTGATPTSETLKTTPKTDDITTYSSCDEDPSSCSEAKGVHPTPMADRGFNCSFGLLDKHDLCGWSQDPTSDLTWSFHSHATRMDNTGMSHDHGPGSGNYLKLETGEPKGHLRARIVSPVMSITQDPLCLVFRYHVQHDNMNLLLVFLKTTGQDERELWLVKGNQENDWKEGRIILPIHPAEYQVVFEGVTNYGYKTNIGIDDVHVVNNVPIGQCREPVTATISNEPDARGSFPPGIEPTMDTVSVQPIPTYWYYIMAGGGAFLVLVSVVLAVVLYCHRYRYSAKKNDNSVAFQNSHFTSGVRSSIEPILIVKAEKEDHSLKC
ncbi:neuropilin-2-like [Protopterus annectens]|uniref:neuropilin-2-like n=1 Tax=Protopterus annectens TaxID=7888 RepID=UPI001CF943C3|nr:neuropilin-2-like [Protopterus annectens]